METARFQNPRSESRMHVGLSVQLRYGLLGLDEAKGSIVDISERGMSVHCHVQFRVGTRVKANLEGASGNVKAYRVVWVRNAETSGQANYIGLQLKS
jgi:hypothetical protein